VELSRKVVGTRNQIEGLQRRLSHVWIISRNTHVNHGTADLSTLECYGQRSIYSLETDIGRIFQCGGQWRDNELVTTITTTARDRDIAQSSVSIEVIKALWRSRDSASELPLNKSFKPCRSVRTSNGIPEIGTLPMLVLAVTLAVPWSSTKGMSPRIVTMSNKASKASIPLVSSLNGSSGMFSQERARLAGFPVETPAVTGCLGMLS
jgi:hypothetical protein